MGYTSSVIPSSVAHTRASKRRCFIPEPPPCLPNPKAGQQVYQVNYFEEMPRKQHKHKGTIKAEITHTSCLTAIRNYVINMQKQPRRKHRRKGDHNSRTENPEYLICSLKKDIQLISKYEQDTAENPDKVNLSDPFFILSAMMCKVNKLEDVIIKLTNCEKQLERRREMLTTAECIKKHLTEQLHCDEKLMKEKRKKLCYLVRSLDIFEKQIKCMTKSVKYKGEISKSQSTRSHRICSCIDKSNCSESCPGRKDPCFRPPCKPPEHPCLPCHPPPPLPSPPCSTPCKTVLPNHPQSRGTSPTRTDTVQTAVCNGPQLYDITGVNLTYTKSCVETDESGKEKETVQKKLHCNTAEENEFEVTLIREGNKCDPCEDPELKARIDNISKVWLESARQLIDAFCNCPSC